MKHAVADEENIRTRRLGDLAAPVEHQRIVISSVGRSMFRQGADHIKSSRLRPCRRGIRRRSPPLRDVQTQTLRQCFITEVGAPLPCCDRKMRLGLLCRDAHLLGAAPGNRPNVAVGQTIGRNRRFDGRVDRIDRPRQVEAQNLCRLDQPPTMLRQRKDVAVVAAHAFEHGAGVVEGMGQHMHSRVSPWNECAIVPDLAITVVEGRVEQRHSDDPVA